MNATAHVMISGRVQGVGFRAWTVGVARKIGLDGWVRNRADGTVEAVFSGTEEGIEAIVSLCHQGPLASRVEAVTIIESDETVPAGSGFHQRETV